MRASFCWMFAIMAGCTDEVNAPPNLAPFAIGDASYPSDADRRIDGEGDKPARCRGGASYQYAVRSLVTIERTSDDPAQPSSYCGFDLDGRVSDGTQPEDCNLRDDTSSDGRPGIDNAIGGLWTEDFAKGFSTSIRKGSTTLLRIDGVDDLRDDDCVDVSWTPGRASESPPRVDDAGGLLPGQSFSPDRLDEPQFRRARIVNGRLEARSPDLALVEASVSPWGSRPEIWQPSFPLVDLSLAIELGTEESAAGALGGALTPKDLLGIYETAYPDLVAGYSGYPTDLPYAGKPCARLSAGFCFVAVKTSTFGR
jgi:hypothetical protein